MENKMLDNIAYLLKPNRGEIVQTYKDIFAQDLNDKIASAYDVISQVKGTAKKGDLAVAASKLGKKYESLGSLIKKGKSLDEVCTSQEYRELSDNCTVEAEQFFRRTNRCDQ